MDLQFVNLLPSPDLSVETDTIPVSLVQIFRGADGADGKPGTGTLAAEGVCGADMQAGQPVIIGRVDGKLYPANAATLGAAFVIGLAAATTAAGFVTQALAAKFVLADWTLVTGSAALSPGLPYFLDPDGSLTTSAPSSQGQAVTEVGIAVSATTMLVSPKQPILL